MSTLEVTVINAFVGPGCRGNPAGVCMPPAGLPNSELQRIACEMGLSETAFVHSHKGALSIRWFTPTIEVELCGHATLAAAAWLWSRAEYADRAELVFESQSGPLRCFRSADEVIFVVLPAFLVRPASPEEGLFEALGLEEAEFVGLAGDYFLVDVGSEALVRGLQPNFDLLARLKARGVFVTARSGTAPYDFVSRCFFPKEGIPEDPVTGSAHGALGPYWSQKLQMDRLRAFQASAEGGDLRIEIQESGVILGGKTQFASTRHLTAVHGIDT